MADHTDALVVENATKIYTARKRYPGKIFSAASEVVGVRNVNLRVAHGESVGLIGENGSGKTTLLKLMSGALSPTYGKVMAPFRPRLISLAGLQLPNLSVLENTELMLRAHGRSAKEAGAEALDLIELAELGDKTHLPYNTLSTGMRARIGFFLATINQPEVLLMDEMLSVADKRFQEKAQQIIQAMMQRAHGVVISSHSMSTITDNCARSVVLHKGRVVFDGPSPDAVSFYSEVKQWA